MNNSKIQLVSILVFAIIVALVLARFAQRIQPLLAIEYNWIFELTIVLGQLVFQGAFIVKNSWKQLVNYSFQVMLVSLMGAALLIPLTTVYHMFDLNNAIMLICFFSIILMMFFEHRRRLKKLQLPWYLSYTWVLYRCLILLLILPL